MKPLLAILAALVAAAFPALARAQTTPVTVYAELASQQVYVGDTLDLTIQVDGSSNPSRPTLNLPPNLQGEFAGGADRSSHFVSIVNGRRQERSSLGYSFQYRLTPTRSGDYTIPAIEVVVDGKPYRTNSVSFTAVPAPQSDSSRLRLEVEKKSLYVGEQTRLRITWLIVSEVRGFRFSDLYGGDAFDLTNPRDRLPTGRQQQDQNIKELSLFGRNVVATIGSEVIDGRQYTSVTMEQVITPKEPGSFELGPISVAFDQLVGRQRPADLFDIFNNAASRRAVATSLPVTIEVRPLPAEGKPADFGGLVGSYSLKSVAEPKEVGIGDPITLKLTINGPESLDHVAAPPLESTRGFADSFKLSPEGWTASSTPRGREFTTTIRATNPSVSAIPSLELPYFDVDTGRYSVARSDPIPLKVRATRMITAADAIRSSAPGSSTPIASSQTLESTAPGLPANYESHDALVNEGTGLGDRLRSPAVLAALAAPAGIYLALSLTLAVRRIRHPNRPRLTQSLRRARRNLARSDSPAAIADALRAYVGEVTHHQAITLTGDDCATLLERSSPPARDAAKSLGTLLSRCDAQRFGGPEPETAALRREALEALNTLDGDLRRSA